MYFEKNLAYNTPRPPMSVHKKNQPSQSSRLAAIRNIYVYTYAYVLFYYIEVILKT